MPKSNRLVIFFLTVVAACGLAGRLWAEDAQSEVFKTYHRKELGIEFRYPADMQVVVSTTSATAVQLVYRSLGEHGPVDVEATVSVNRCYSAESALTSWYRNPDVRQQIMGGHKMNGFYVGDNTTDCGMGGNCLFAQHFVQRSSKGLCYVVSRAEWASKRWNSNDLSPEDQKNKDDFDKHYEDVMEVVRSFRIRSK